MWKWLCHWHLFIIILIHPELRCYDGKQVRSGGQIFFTDFGVTTTCVPKIMPLLWSSFVLYSRDGIVHSYFLFIVLCLIQFLSTCRWYSPNHNYWYVFCFNVWHSSVFCLCHEYCLKRSIVLGVHDFWSS
jgi:hypothetical protein